MAECSASSSSWSNVSSASQRYRDLDTAAMHFWIDKRGTAGPHGVPHHGHGRYSHRVSASLASSRLPPGAAPQRRRRPSRSSRTNVAKATTPAVHRPGDASTSGTTTSTTTALTASSLAGGSGSSSGSARRVGGAAPVLAPAPLLARAARAHLALPRPRPHLAYM
ncbi:uncharacterized protein LOC127750231 [Frankliniella occidentalis]|uniref:Uncharacterized protein LOC127750231 n=1 Tax=Frankliniella occidentalis TaxID=133901 RepID=A0A9C6X156_FRAOC|nr:uncharacterized protein LOC127750231 [Frankliniella occidentalis]